MLVDPLLVTSAIYVRKEFSYGHYNCISLNTSITENTLLRIVFDVKLNEFTKRRKGVTSKVLTSNESGLNKVGRFEDIRYKWKIVRY